VSVLKRKRPGVVDTVTVRTRRLKPLARNARQAAMDQASSVRGQAGSVKDQAGSVVKDQASSVMDRVDSVKDWAAPHVDTARVWAAPHVERTGVAVRDNVAPKVSDLLVATARKMESAAPHVERAGIAVRDNVAPKVSDLVVDTARRLDSAPLAKRRRWPRRIGIAVLVAAAGSAVAAVVMRRRSYSADFGPMNPVPDLEPDLTVPTPATTNGDGPMDEVDADGQHRMA
jgi:hypothetical protein